MSTTIDSKVVEMKFDNALFERNVSTSMGTIDKLKSKLDFSGVARGLEGISSAAGNVNMSAIGNSIQEVHTKFSALEIAAYTIFSNLTNAAIGFGKRIAMEFINPIKTGFSEYETQIGAIQTILANTSSKGTTLQEVNAALNELNTYSDKTIYNFTEMTKNIGTFTAAGVDLKTSVAAIKGIANLAAASGSNAQQAATAMYQLSQALSTGTVKLMDWNSVTNAGMGGELFKNSLIETAKVHDIAIDDMIKSEGSFRETLQNGWLTSEILTETLAKFTGDLSDSQLKTIGYSDEQIKKIQEMAVIANDAATKVKTFSQLIETLKEAMQSGWTQSWQLLIGDFGEAKELLTDISNIAGKIISDNANARNTVLLGGLSTGWKQFLNEGIADEEGLKESLQSVAEEMQLQAAVQTYGEDFSDTLKRGWVSAEVLQKGVSKLTSKMSAMSDAELEAAGYTKEQVSQMVDLNWQIATGNINLEEFAKNMARPSGRENLIEALKNSFEQLLRILAPIKEAFLEVFPAMTGEQLYDLTVKIKNLTSGFSLSAEKAETIKKIFKGLFSVLGIGVQVVSAIFNGIKSLVSGLADLFGGVSSVASGWADWTIAMNDALKETDFFNTVIQKVVSWIIAATSTLKEFSKKAYKSIKEFIALVSQKIGFTGFTSFEDFMTRVTDKMNQMGLDATNLKDKISTALTILGDDIKNSEFVKYITKILDFIKKIGAELGPAAKDFGQNIKDTFSNMTFDQFEKTTKLGIAGAITAILGDIGLKLAGIFKESGKFIESLVGILDAVKGCLEAWQTSLKADVLQKIAIAVAILAASILILTFIDPMKLAAATAAIASMVGALMASMYSFSKSAGGLKDTLALIGGLMAISVAVLILASAIAILANIEDGKIGGAFLVMTGLITEIMVFVILLNKTKTEMTTGMAQLMAVAIAIRIMCESIAILGKMDQGQLIQGGIAISALMVIMGAFIKFTATNKDMASNAVSASIGVLIISASMIVFAMAAEKFGKIPKDQFYQGVGAILALMIVIGIFVKFTEGSDNTLKVGLMMMALAKGMGYMADAIGKLGLLKFEQMAQGLVGMGLILLAVFMFVNGLSAVDPKNLVAVSASLLIVSGAMYVISLAIEKMASIPAEALKNSLLAMGLLLAEIGIILGLLSTVGPVAIVGAAAILVVAVALIAIAGALTIVAKIPVEDIKKSIIAISVMLIVLIAAGALALLVAPGLAVLALAMVALGAAMFGLGMGIMFLASGLNMLATIGIAGANAITAVATSLFDLIPLFIQKIAEGIIAFCQAFIDGMPVVIETVTTLGLAILSALEAIIPKALEVLGCFLVELWKMLEGAVPKMAESALNIITALLQSIADHAQDIIEAAISIVVNLLEGIAEKLPDVIQSAFDLVIAFINGLADAINNNHDAIYDAVEKLIDAMVQAFNDFVVKFGPIGKNIVDGVIKGIKDCAGSVKDAVVSVGTTMLNGLKSALGIKSPSKEMAKLGRFADLGLVKGINDYASLASDASAQMGTDSVNAMSDALSSVGDAIGGDVDMTPVVRPVMDLTNVNAGTKAIDSMFGEKTIDISTSRAQVEATSSEMNATRDQTTQSDMSTSIDDMTSELKKALLALKDSVPKIEFNGQYSFKDQTDIDYFMNQAALLIDRGID